MVSIGFAVAIGKIGLEAHRSGSKDAQQLPLPESLKEEPATGMKSKS